MTATAKKAYEVQSKAHESAHKGDGEEDLMTTDRKRVVKHLKLNSLSLAKPEGLSSRR